MNVENNKDSLVQGADAKFDANTRFHIALGWLTALSVSIAAAATLT